VLQLLIILAAVELAQCLEVGWEVHLNANVVFRIEDSMDSKLVLLLENLQLMLGLALLISHYFELEDPLDDLQVQVSVVYLLDVVWEEWSQALRRDSLRQESLLDLHSLGHAVVEHPHFRVRVWAFERVEIDQVVILFQAEELSFDFFLRYFFVEDILVLSEQVEFLRGGLRPGV